MNKIKQIKHQFASEISQKHELQKKIILQILCSKRLLSEHLENLEEVANVLFCNTNTKTNHLTFISTSSTLVTSFALFKCFSNNARYLIPFVAGIFPVMYLHKAANWKQLVYCEAQLKDFIKALDEFEFSVKKATSFLNDAQYLKGQADNLKRYCNQDKNLTVDLFNLTRRVIRALYCFLKYLEICFKIDDKFEYFYQDIDDVDNCEIMLDAADSNIAATKFKEMFALFAYVQSYLLFRLGVIIATNVDEAKFVLKDKISDITSKVKHQILFLPNFLLVQKEQTELQENMQKLIDSEESMTMPKDLVLIRSSTIDFTSKILSLVHQLKEYHSIVITLTNNYENTDKKDFMDVLNCLEIIGSQISVCSDEQNRLLILLSKYLDKDVEKLNAIEFHDKSETDGVPLTMYDEDEQPYQTDEFFYVDPQQENAASCDHEKSTEYNEDLDEEDLQVKITKKSFKPVLAQLKERIVVIDYDMKEREKKILKEKGIEIQEEPPMTDDTSETGYDSDLSFQTKLGQNRNMYEESRNFLQDKNQVNLFAQGNILPIKNNFITLHEDVLE